MRRGLVLATRVLLLMAMAFILFESTIRHPLDPQVEGGDKIMHALAFCALSFLADFSFPEEGFGFRKIALLTGYGILIEIVQSFLPWRSAEVSDLLADASGMGVYLLFLPLLKQVPLLRDRWNV
jgi:VanZ family protein